MQKLDPKAVWMFFFRILTAWSILFIFLSFWLFGFLASSGVCRNTALAFWICGSAASYILWIVIIFALFVVLCWFWAKLTYHFFNYQLTEHAFKKEHGIIWKKYVSIPYERIQNVDIYRGVITRILGLSDLHIQTAGYSGVTRGRARGIRAEGYVPGLDKHIAEQLREELIRRTHGRKQGL